VFHVSIWGGLRALFGEVSRQNPPRGDGTRVQLHPQKFWFGDYPDKIWGNLCKICVNLSKIAVRALILRKWHPKIFLLFIFWKSCINLVIFGQLKGNLGKFWWNLDKNGAKNASIWKQCVQWNAVVFLWRSFSLDCFSGKFVEIWAKILRTTKNLIAPTPMFQLHALYRWNRHRLQAICK